MAFSSVVELITKHLLLRLCYINANMYLKKRISRIVCEGCTYLRSVSTKSHNVLYIIQA